DHFLGAVPADLVAPLHRAHSAHHRLDRPTEAMGGSDDLVGDFAQRAVALLQHREDRAHSTLASSRSSRTSSPTAPAPSPTIFPSFRSGGGVSAMTSIAPAPACTGLTSSGFFLAAMMPLRAG